MVARNSPDWLPAGWMEKVNVKNGRKVKYYSNVETGQKFYSKNDVIRYVETGSVRTPQPRSNHNKRHSKKKPMALAVKTKDFPEWLPHGWSMEVKTRKTGLRIGTKYKCYIDPVTKWKFYSKPEVFQYLKTVKRSRCTSKQKKIGFRSVSNRYIDQSTGAKSSLKPVVSQKLTTVKGKSCTSKQEKISIGKRSVNNVVVERVTLDGLPPGWIKEIKIQRKANGIRKDPYYTDPVSGYIFRSKKDALRYLETGDINSCAIKPQKRGINDLALINDEISSQPAGNKEKSSHHATRRRLFAGKEICDTSSLVAPDAEGSEERQCEILSADAPITSTPTAEILEEKHLLDNVIEKCAETKESSDPSSSALPKIKGSKRKQGKRVFTKNGPVSTPATDILQEEKSPENGMERLSKRKTRSDSSKCKNEKAVSLSYRSSKRLAGLKPELVANLGLSERSLRAAARKSGESEANSSLGLALDGVAASPSQQLEGEPETKIEHHVSKGTDAPSDVEPSNKSEKPLEDQAVPDEQPGKQETEKKYDGNPDPQLLSPFGDSWSDPCLEFAFKTLTGAIPIEDNVAIQGYFQQQVDTSHTQRDGCLALPDFGLPSFFQNDISSHFDAPEKPMCKQQLSANPTFLAPGNVNLPSCSDIGPQQPSLEGNKEYQAKVN